MDLLAQLSWFDLVIIVILAVGVFAGFTQGMIRYVLNVLAVIVAFVLASQLKGPVIDLLGFWRAFSPGGRELIVYVLLFVVFVVGGFFAIRAFYKRTRLPVIKQLDEIGGAIFGLLFAAMVLTFQLLVLDSFYKSGGEQVGWLGSYYEALNDSLLISYFREVLIPTAGYLARPFLPREIANLLVP